MILDPSFPGRVLGLAVADTPAELILGAQGAAGVEHVRPDHRWTTRPGQPRLTECDIYRVGGHDVRVTQVGGHWSAQLGHAQYDAPESAPVPAYQHAVALRLAAGALGIPTAPMPSVDEWLLGRLLSTLDARVEVISADAEGHIGGSAGNSAWRQTAIQLALPGVAEPCSMTIQELWSDRTRPKTDVDLWRGTEYSERIEFHPSLAGIDGVPLAARLAAQLIALREWSVVNSLGTLAREQVAAGLAGTFGASEVVSAEAAFDVTLRTILDAALTARPRRLAVFGPPLVVSAHGAWHDGAGFVVDARIARTGSQRAGATYEFGFEMAPGWTWTRFSAK